MTGQTILVAIVIAAAVAYFTFTIIGRVRRAASRNSAGPHCGNCTSCPGQQKNDAPNC